jgi:glycosyltransferase involved in cell wall biosynthesis
MQSLSTANYTPDPNINLKTHNTSTQHNKTTRTTPVQPIDVIILTKDSQRTLTQCLTSVYNNIPVKNLIIIDNHSTDKTHQILKTFNKKHHNIKTITQNGTRAQARQTGIQHATTPWLLFVDSDVTLSPNWAQKAEQQIQPDTGAIWGLNIDITPNMNNHLLLTTMAIIAQECFKLRGGTHDTLIRTQLVKDIQIPQQLHTYEDQYIINHIKNKGYKTTIANESYCLHHGPIQNNTLKQGLTNAKQEITCGLTYTHSYKNLLYYPFLTLYWLLRLQNKTPKHTLHNP